MKNVYKDRECKKTVKIGVFLNIASIGPKIKPSIKHFFSILPNPVFILFPKATF